MKKINEFISFIDKNIPITSCEIKNIGKGYILQAVMLSAYTKRFEIKDDAKPGIYIGDKKKNNEDIEIQCIEVLYTSRAEEKLYSRMLVDELNKRLQGKYVYLTTLERGKTELLIQFYVLDKVNRYNYNE